MIMEAVAVKRNQPRTIISISVPGKYKPVLEAFDRLVRLERCKYGRSELTIRAWQEYLERHSLGNPQTVLEDRAASEETRLQAGVRYLKVKCKLSIRQIAQITGRGRGTVQRVVKGVDVKPVLVRKGNFDLNVWRQRWILFKQGVPAEEAFKW